jgi:hypothetical protein
MSDTTELTREQRAEQVHEALKALVARTRADGAGNDFDEELAVAGEFVAAHGSLGLWYEEPQLTRIQFAAMTPHALGLIGHWSTARNDPEPQPPAGLEEHLTRCEVCRYLEGVYSLYDRFQYELCEICGLDLDAHDIGVMGGGLGTVHCMCREPWTRTEPMVQQVEGVEQSLTGTAWQASWTAPLADGTTAVFASSYYHTYDHDSRVVVERMDGYRIPGGSVVADTGTFVYVRVESDDPAEESLEALAEQASPPLRGEWAQHMGDTEFLLGGDS